MSDTSIASLNMSKGQSLSFKKAAPTSTIFKVGLGWSKGVDLDVAAFGLATDGKLPRNSDGTPNGGFVCYFNQEVTVDGAMHHLGDNRNGAGEGDDEIIVIDLAKLDPAVAEISIVACFYEPANGMTFGKVPETHIRILDQNDNEICIYRLDQVFADATGVQFGSLIKDPVDGWKFTAVGQGYVANLEQFLQQYI